MVSDKFAGLVAVIDIRLNPCSNGIWSLTIVLQTPSLTGGSLNPCSNGIWSLTSDSAVTSTPINVLILVLMEYGLWLSVPDQSYCFRMSLNPCSNGIWSLTLQGSRRCGSGKCLNPCSNGIWSLTDRKRTHHESSCVLILVLMEYGLWLKTTSGKSEVANVLILVLMEYGLWPSEDITEGEGLIVLILVLMEYGLWRNAVKC